MEKHNISIAYWNIDGLYQRCGGQRICKLDDPDVQNSLGRFDLIGLVETHCSNKDSPMMEDFHIICSNRPKSPNAPRHFGGIALCIKKSIKKGVKLLPVTNSEILWAKLDKNFFNMDSDLFLGIAYVSPISSTYSKRREDIFELLELDVAKYSKLGHCFMAGDFNARTNCERDFTTGGTIGDDEFDQNFHDLSATNDLPARTNLDTSPVDNHGQKLLSLCKSSDLYILNGRTIGDTVGSCTCFSHTGVPSVIHYMLASSECRRHVEYFHVHGLSHLSIHCMLSSMIKTNVFRLAVENNTLTPPGRKFKWQEGDDIKFRTALYNPTCQGLISKFNDIELNSISSSEAVESVNNILLTAAKEAHIRQSGNKGKKTRKRSNKKWYDRDCYLMLKDVRKLATKLRTRPYDMALLGRYRVLKKRYKHLLKKKKSCYKQNIMKRFEQLRENDPQSFWKLFGQLRDLDKETMSNPIDPDEWVKHFQNVMNTSLAQGNKQFDQHMDEFITSNKDKIFNELNFIIKETEVRKAIVHLKTGKATGKDQIPNEMLKASETVLVPVYTKLFNHIFSTSTFPTPWRYNCLTPLHKKGDKHVTDNYRGIALSSNVSKLFCYILQHRLQTFLDLHKIIPVNQIGFKKSSRTSDHVLTLKAIIDKFVNKLPRGNLYSCFVDFKKAFDSISRRALFYKMLKVGIGGNFVNTIMDMYSEVYFCVKTGSGYTTDFASTQGVKQGCILSPTLFNLYLHDLPDIFDSSCDPVKLHDVDLSCLMYADDLVLLSSTASGLQCALDKLAQYCNRWQLVVNMSKSKVILFNKGGHKIKKYSFTYNGNPLEIVNQYCYLGIIFSSSGTFKAATEDLMDRASRAMFALKQYETGGNILVSLKLFDSLVLPVLRYCSEIWSPFTIKNLNDSNFLKLCDTQHIEKLHTKFCKYLLGVGSKATNAAVKGELGRHALLVKFLSHSAKYWLRLCAHDTSSLVYKAYLDLYSNMHLMKDNWAGHIKKLWQNFGMKGIWENHGTKYPHKIVRTLECKMLERYEHHWMALIGLSPTFNSIQNSSKLRTYCLFKSNFVIENYLLMERNFTRRQNMSKLRISAHRLNIETGRYVRPPLPPEERLCLCCNTNSVENEMHFVLDCPLYTPERETLLNSLETITGFDLYEHRNLFHLIMSINGGDRDFLNPILHFVTTCLEKREIYLESINNN